jgi:hypothetical protein
MRKKQAMMILLLLVSAIVITWTGDFVRRKFFYDTTAVFTDPQDGSYKIQTPILSGNNPQEELPLDIIPDGFEVVSYLPSDVHSGTLLVISEELPLANVVAYETMRDFSGKNNGYRLKDYSLRVADEAFDGFDGGFGDFYAATAIRDVMIFQGYKNEKSLFGTGHAIDVRILRDGAVTEFSRSGQYEQLVANMAHHGVIYEPTTGAGVFRYVGMPHSQVMFEKGFETIEEYLEFLQNYTYKEPFKTGEFSVYYIKTTAELKLLVPIDSTYTINGNNEDALVVTCVKEAE